MKKASSWKYLRVGFIYILKLVIKHILLSIITTKLDKFHFNKAVKFSYKE